MANITTDNVPWALLVRLPTIQLAAFVGLLGPALVRKLCFLSRTIQLDSLAARHFIRVLQHFPTSAPSLPRATPLAIISHTICRLNTSRITPQTPQRIPHQIWPHRTHRSQRAFVRRQQSMERHLPQPPRPTSLRAQPHLVQENDAHRTQRHHEPRRSRPRPLPPRLRALLFRQKPTRSSPRDRKLHRPVHLPTPAARQPPPRPNPMVQLPHLRSLRRPLLRRVLLLP
jgi:hypothetical protein